MPRRRRAFCAGLFHLAPHASDARYLFPGGASRELFLPALAAMLERYETGLVAYALMGTHYHAVVHTTDARLPNALQRLHGWYSRTQNTERERSAHLFRAHYFAREIGGDDDLLTVCRYVAYNPVRARLASDAFAWPWSSAAASAGFAQASVPLDLEPLQAAFGHREDWPRAYREFIEEGGSEMEPDGLEPALPAFLTRR